MPNQGGGSEGSLAKDHIFSGFFFVHPSLIVNVFASSKFPPVLKVIFDVILSGHYITLYLKRPAPRPLHYI